MMEQTIKCPICGRPYKVHSMTVADQSACPSCMAEAERRALSPTEHEEDVYRRRRERFFGESS